MNKLPKATLFTVFLRGKYQYKEVSWVAENNPEYILWCVEHERMYEFSDTVIRLCMKKVFGIAIKVGQTLTYNEKPNSICTRLGINMRSKVSYPHTFTVAKFQIRINDTHSWISMCDENGYAWSINNEKNNIKPILNQSINSNERSINDLPTTSSTQSSRTGSKESSFRCKIKPEFASAQDSFNGITAFKSRAKIQFGN